MYFYDWQARHFNTVDSVLEENNKPSLKEEPIFEHFTWIYMTFYIQPNQTGLGWVVGLLIEY